MLTSEQAAVIQRRVIETTGGVAGIRDAEVLQKVLARPLAAPGGVPKHPTLFNQVAVLIQGIAYEKPFVAANRRAALVAAALVLHARGWRLTAEQADVERLMHGIELGITTWHRITVWIKGHTERTGPTR